VTAILWLVWIGFPAELNFWPLDLLIFVPVIVLVMLGATVVAVVIIIRALRTKRWRSAISAAVLPLVAIAVCIYPYGAMQTLREAGDRFHFYVMRSHYLAEVAARSNEAQPRLIVWNWGGMIWSSKGVIYDESDEIALPVTSQSADWKSRASGSELVCGDYSFEALGNHFYLTYFPC
jgi:hypothetical protein